ncbi:MAG: site-specific DNA-methyltransferase [Treponema sp.]|nr:site-specific DNA-methyltransferase [Treponema sp.]
MEEKKTAPRNRTLKIEENEREELKRKLITKDELEQNFGQGGQSSLSYILNKTINAELLSVLPLLPDSFADLIIIDPPYNLTKNFNGSTFNARSDESYDEYLSTWFPLVCKKLKSNGSLYICGDWKCTSSLQRAVEKELTVMNRITWQREKGRGAKSNWKNSMEDIWFAVKDKDDYYFDVEAVKFKRKVIAPYKVDGQPKDWQQTEEGNYRITYPSNFWDDISVPFWSMPENTEHPTQKPEKLYAKLILASSKPGDVIFDPFLGSGTASVTAKKLDRNYVGIEMNEEYCLFAEKRLMLAQSDRLIQGYSNGVFWERNSGR